MVLTGRKATRSPPYVAIPVRVNSSGISGGSLKTFRKGYGNKERDPRESLAERWVGGDSVKGDSIYASLSGLLFKT